MAEPVAPSPEESLAAAEERAVAAKRKALEIFEQSPESVRMSADVARLLQELEAARVTKESAKYLPASSAYNTARLKFESMKSTAVKSDAEVIASESELRHIQLQVSAAKAAAATKERESMAIAGSELRRMAELQKPIGPIRVGAVGSLPGPILVIQIKDQKTMIVSHGADTLWLEGFSTTGMVDDKRYRLDAPVTITGTKSYETAFGQRTIFTAAPAK